MTADEAERFWAKVDKTGVCWLWTASVRRGGYGQFWSARAGRIVGAHRWAYEEMVGPIPDGLYLDHLCRNPRCVNPEHLEPVTNGENLRRGVNPIAVNAAKTHCPQGHPLSGDNLRVIAGGRRCLECDRRRTRDARRRRLERDPDYEKKRWRKREAKAANRCCDCDAPIGSRGTRCKSCMMRARHADVGALEEVDAAFRGRENVVRLREAK